MPQEDKKFEGPFPSSPQKNAGSDLFNALKEEADLTPPTPEISLPYPLRNVLNTTQEKMTTHDLKGLMETYRDELWTQQGFPPINLLRPGSQNNYYQELIRSIKSRGIDFEEVASSIEPGTYTDPADESEKPKISINLNHPDIKNDALKAIEVLQRLLLVQASIKQTIGEIESSQRTPELIKQIVERANQTNLINQMLMFATVSSKGTEIDPELIASNVSKTLELGEFSLFSEEGALEKYQQSINTQE